MVTLLERLDALAKEYEQAAETAEFRKEPGAIWWSQTAAELRAIRAQIEKEREAVRKEANEIIGCLGPEPPDCGCQGCKVEMQMALEAAHRLREIVHD